MRGKAGKHSYRYLAVTVAAALLASLAACTDDPPQSRGVDGEPADGGTVRVLTTLPGFTSLDPQRIYVTDDAMAAKLMTRTLTTFKAKPGVEGGELVGDLATDTGRPNADNTGWDFTLRDGIKWDNGKPVTCADVRYGVLRNFDVRREDDAAITGGPTYPTQWLDVDSDYQGPKADGTGDVGGVSCVDDTTIHFDLKVPAANFPSAVAMTAFSPVPEDLDTWADYGDAPASTGPYRLAKYTPSTDDEPGTAVFERNKQWDAETDAVRRAAPDKIVYEFSADVEYATQQIIADNPEFANVAILDNLPGNYVQQVVNDDQLSSQTVSGATETTQFLAINSESVSELDCRKALVYAFNKRKYLDVAGGETFGAYATTMIGPDDPAHSDFDVFGTGNEPDGDLDKAQELFDSADCPSTLTLDIADTERGGEYADTIVTTYSRIGVTVKLNKIPPNDFFKELSYPSKVDDLVLSAWAPDWPGGSGVIPPLFDGDLVQDGLNSNYSLLDDDDVNAAIDEASKESDPERAGELWGALDEQIAKLAVMVPIFYVKVNSLCGKDIRGAFLNSQWSSVDVGSLGLAEGA